MHALLRRPALALESVLVLAAGLGFGTAAFSIVNTLLLHPYPYPELDRLVIVRDHRLAEGAHQGNPIASGDFVDLRRDNRVFTGIAAWRGQALVLTGSGDPERIEGLAVSANFFDVLGARMASGRGFAPGEDEAGRDDRVVVSRRYWSSHFAGDPSFVGRTIILNGRAMTVVGLVADESYYPPGIDAWVPLVISASDATERASQRLLDVARLRPGVSLRTAREDLDRVAARLAADYPPTNRGRGFDLLELRKEQYEFTESLFVLVQLCAVLVLLLGAANVVNLLLAQAIDRRQELAIRMALGASRIRVAGLLLVQALSLSCLAGVAGTFAAIASIPLIHAALPEGIARWIAGWMSIRVDWTVAGVAAGATLVTGAALGCVTGWQATRVGALVDLRGAGRSGIPRLTWVRRLLIVSEVVLAVSLLTGSAVTVRGFRAVSRAFSELEPAAALRFRVALPQERYRTDQAVREFQDRLIADVANLPGVVSAGLIRNEVASNVSNPLTPFVIEGQPPRDAGETPRAEWQTISPGAFEALHIKALRGRVLVAADSPTAPRVAVISAAMARRYFSDSSYRGASDPVGARIQIGAVSGAWTTIVGVVEDFKLNWYDMEPHPTLYLPSSQVVSPQMYVIVRARSEPLALAGPIRRAAARLDPLQPLSGMERMDTTISDSLSPVRVLGILLAFGGALAVIFAATGIQGVLSHWVSARWREFGVRLALGASGGMVIRQLVVQTLTFAATGLMIAVPVTWAGLQLVRERLFGLAVVDVPTLSGVSLLVVCIVSIAAIGPARRLRRVDPSSLLRAE